MLRIPNLSRLYLLHIILICTSTSFFAQQQSIEYSNVPDSTKVLEEIAIALKHFQDADFQNSIYHSQKALEMAETINFNFGKIEATRLLGGGYKYIGAPEKAFILYKSALEQAKASQEHAQVSKIYNNIGNLLTEQGKRSEGLEYYHKGLELGRSTKDTFSIVSTLSNIALIYTEQGDFDSAIDYFNKSLSISSFRNDTAIMCKTHINLGNQYGLKKDYEQSLHHHQLALAMAEVMKNSVLTNTIVNNMGETYFLQNKIDLAKVYLNKALKIEKEMNDQQGMVFTHNSIAKVYNKTREFLRANQHFQESLRLTKELSMKNIEKEVYRNMATNYAQMKEYSLAFESLQQFVELNDSLFSKQKTQQILELSTKYETEEKEAENKLLKEQKARTDAELERKNILTASISLLLFSVSLIAFFFYKSNQQKKLYNQQLKKEVRLLNENLENKKTIEAQAKQLKKAEEQKNILFANIAHELQTPLTLINSPLENLLSKSGREEHEEKDLKLISNYSNQLLSLTHQILDVIKNKFDQLDINLFSFNLKAMVDYLSFEFTPKAKSQNLELTFINNLKTDPTLVTDVEKLLTVLRNLIINAIKYSKNEGMIKVLITMDQDTLILVISDQGQGIKEEDIALIFEPYYQTNSSNVRLGGIGLGLSICKNYIESLDGTIRVESTYNKGSDFIVELPVEMVDKQNDNNIPKYQFPEVYQTTPLVLPKIGPDFLPENYILIVEDNFDICHHLNDILKKEYLIAFAHDGHEAIRQIEQKTPKVIITDWMMKGMDGKELVENLKSNNAMSAIPILMLTARNQPDDRLSMLRIGVDNYLTKPFVPDSLKAQVNHLVDLAESRQAEAEDLKENPHLDKSDIAFLKKLETITKTNISNFDFTLADMCEDLDLGIRQVNRRIKKLTGLTPMKYVNEVRFQEAKRMLEDREYSTVKAVIYSVGFKSEKNFSRNFKKRFGKYPKEILY